MVYLAGSSYWYPVFDSKLISFSLEVELPHHWDAVSQGERTGHFKNEDNTRVKWESPEPQEDIYLIASRFTEYLSHNGQVTVMAFLRAPDEELANKYLEAASGYIAMYDKLIGPYPYKKFALVENFWETGLGMPSFTLLGPDGHSASVYNHIRPIRMKYSITGGATVCFLITIQATGQKA